MDIWYIVSETSTQGQVPSVGHNSRRDMYMAIIRWPSFHRANSWIYPSLQLGNRQQCLPAQHATLTKGRSTAQRATPKKSHSSWQRDLMCFALPWWGSLSFWHSVVTEKALLLPHREDKGILLCVPTVLSLCFCARVQVQKRLEHVEDRQPMSVWLWHSEMTNMCRNTLSA